MKAERDIEGSKEAGVRSAIPFSLSPRIEAHPLSLPLVWRRLSDVGKQRVLSDPDADAGRRRPSR